MFPNSPPRRSWGIKKPSVRKAANFYIVTYKLKRKPSATGGLFLYALCMFHYCHAGCKNKRPIPSTQIIIDKFYFAYYNSFF